MLMNPVQNIKDNRIKPMLIVPISFEYLYYVALEHLYAIERGIAPGIREQFSGFRTLVDSHLYVYIYMHDTV